MRNDTPLKSPYEETDECKIDKYKTDEASRHSSAFEPALRLILKEGFDPKCFGNRLYAARKEAKISQIELGKVIGVSGVSENCQFDPSFCSRCMKNQEWEEAAENV